MERTLNDIMEFDHVVLVDQDGNVSDAIGMYAPEVEFCPGDWELGTIADVYVGEEWHPLDGFTGQYGYNGCILHPSEFIGGGLEKYILANPGFYVACVVENDYDEATGERDMIGWVVLNKDAPYEFIHSKDCVSCDHDCPWNGNPIGAPYCSICDDHHENASEEID